MAILELENIVKSFPRGFLGKRHQVLIDLDLRIEPGEAFGLLGHNGAGKTTTMHVILGLLKPDSGSVRVFGSDIANRDVRRRIGFLGDEVGAYPFLNANEMLQLTGELCRMKSADLRDRKEQLLKTVGLEDAAKTKIKKYSKGMRQRLGIALALINDPEFLILDEPYSGLDPIGRRDFRELLLTLKDQGKTILMSSHIVPDLEAVCDRVGILSNGQIQKCLELREIYLQKSNPVEITVSGVDPQVFDGMKPNVQIVYHHNEATVVKCDGVGLVKPLISNVYSHGGEVLEVKPLKFGLEDYLLEALSTTSKSEDAESSPGTEESEYVHS